MSVCFGRGIFLRYRRSLCCVVLTAASWLFYWYTFGMLPAMGVPTGARRRAPRLPFTDVGLNARNEQFLLLSSQAM